MRKVKFPAVTHELDFISKHSDEADDIRDGNVKIDPLLKDMSDAVYKRAQADVTALLDHLKNCLQGSADGQRLNNWHWPRYEGGWEIYSDIFSGTKGRKKRIGWAGLHVGYGREGFRLIGFMKPRIGGLDGQRRLWAVAKKKMKRIHLTRDNHNRYPGWADYIIWLDQELTLSTSLEELENELRKETKTFFKIVTPLLNKN
jgi:hypothetical protein